MAYELFFDGFETYASAADMLKFGYSSIPLNLHNTAGRRGGKACECGNVTGFVRSFTPSTHVVMAAAFKVRGNMTINLRNGSTNHASLYIPALGNPTFAVGGAAAVALPSVFPYDTYMFVEIGIAVADANGTAEVKVNGSSVGWFPQFTGDTKNGATTTIDNVQILSNSGSSLLNYIDDFYVTYGDQLEWKGDSRMDRQLLTANALPQDWTPDSGNAWDRLNTGAGYVQSAVDDASSLFEVADLSYNPVSLHGVKVGGLIKKSDAGYREACLLAKSGVTESEGAAVALSTDTLGFTHLMKNDPATGAAWLLPAVQALQAGVRVKV